MFANKNTSPVNLDELKELLRLLDDEDISEFELEEEGLKVRIRKSTAAPATPAVVTAPLVQAVLPPTTPMPQSPMAPPAPAAAASAPTPADADASGDLAIVKSPIVGTFYRSPDPNSPVFVNVGDRVRVGQVLCIIEAMKLMNEIEAEVAGEIVRIHHENGQPVQYGEPIFSIRPER